MFYTRTAGILGQLTGHHYEDQPNFAVASLTSYATALAGNMLAAHLTSRGIRSSRRSKNAVNAAATQAVPAAPIILEADGTIAAASTFGLTAQAMPDTFTLDSETGFTFGALTYAAAVPAALEDFVNDNFVVLPMTPLFYQLDAGGIVGEAMMAIVLANAWLEKFGGDNIDETRRNFNSYQKTIGPRSWVATD